jgi:hypothetical protein
MQEKDFTAAMERAVEKRGGDYRYPRWGEPGSNGYYTPGGGSPTYQNALGEATCLIGAALAELGVDLPLMADKRGAHAVLQGYGLGLKASVAARCAQMHQDRNKRWDESLAIYKAALELQNQDRRYSNPWGVHDLYYAAVEQVTGEPTPVADGYAMLPSMTGDQIMSNYFVEVSEAAKKAAAQVQEHVAMFGKIGSAKTVVQVAPTYASGGIVESQTFPTITGMTVNMTFNPAMTAPSFHLTGGLLQKDHTLVA